MDDGTVLKVYGNAGLGEGPEDGPLVTFALLAYNQEEYIREAIEGAFSQTYSPLEIVLSDDCSSDRTFEIMQEMAREYKGPHLVKVRRSDKNKGLADHINDVIEISKGEIISWAAGDDIALPNRTSKFVDVLLSDNSLCGVHSDLLEIDLSGKPLRERRHNPMDYQTSLGEVVGRGQSVITQSHAFRKVVFSTFGPFRPDLTHEGKAMAFREAALGNVGFISECLTLYRVGSGISTYAGKDIERIKISEPIKYANWYLTAFAQMLDDSKVLECPLDSNLRKKLKRNILFYSNLLAINEGRGGLSPVLKNLLLNPLDMRSIRAAIRRNAPRGVYSRFAR